MIPLRLQDISPKTEILTVDDKRQAEFLHLKTELIDFKKIDLKELQRVGKIMRTIMKRARGIGLSANQIGLNLRFFVAEVPAEGGGRPKFYSVINPTLRLDKETKDLDEGCLSVIGATGLVTRSAKVTLSGFDLKGKPIRIKAWGLLAHIFQHEVDHLHGTLFIDKAKKIYLPPAEEPLISEDAV